MQILSMGVSDGVVSNVTRHGQHLSAFQYVLGRLEDRTVGLLNQKYSIVGQLQQSQSRSDSRKNKDK
jgi:hypothetical protein